jgi:dTDP-4-dehydrorhamnose reductase
MHEVTVQRIGRPILDLVRSVDFADALGASAASLAMNAAAYTAVEADADAGFRGNCDGPAALARPCEADDIPLICVSTKMRGVVKAVIAT